MLQEIQNKSSFDISAHRSILVNVYRTNNLRESKARERERRQKGKSFGSNTFYVYQEFFNIQVHIHFQMAEGECLGLSKLCVFHV